MILMLMVIRLLLFNFLRLNKMSKWLTHVKKTMRQMKGQKKSLGKKWFSTVLKSANKKKKGGAEEESESDSETVSDTAAETDTPKVDEEMGGRRRRHKTQRRRR